MGKDTSSITQAVGPITGSIRQASSASTIGWDHGASARNCCSPCRSTPSRAAIGSISAGQWEAAASLGMTRALTFRRIILPQAIRVILPPMTSDFIALFKDTSLVSVIALVELTKQYQILAKSSARYLEMGLATAVLYLTMSVPLGYLARYLEKRWGKGL